MFVYAYVYNALILHFKGFCCVLLGWPVYFPPGWIGAKFGGFLTVK